MLLLWTFRGLQWFDPKNTFTDNETAYIDFMIQYMLGSSTNEFIFTFNVTPPVQPTITAATTTTLGKSCIFKYCSKRWVYNEYMLGSSSNEFIFTFNVYPPAQPTTTAATTTTLGKHC